MMHIAKRSRVSLRWKLVLSYLLVALGAILILTLAIALAVQNYITSWQLDELQSRATYRAHNLEYAFQSVQNFGGSVQNIAPRRLGTGDPVLLVVVDSSGKQLICDQPALTDGGNCDDTTLKQALGQALQGREGHGFFSVATPDQTLSSLYVSVPLRVDGQIVGAMLLSEPQVHLSDTLLGQVNWTIFLVGLSLACAVVLFSFILARGLTHPLELLTTAAEQMKQGKYTQRVTPPKTQDELGRLAQTFNEMADTIEADMSELREQEQARRDLLANIAHDLATPLTAIQGFSEALADDMLPDALARQETAQRIGREVQRLRRLVGEMQQMSSLESGHAPLDLAPLNLHDLVDETLAVIVPECEQQCISVRNEIVPTLPLVRADSDRITQVLLNLLDNARRHTPENGEICVGAAVRDDNVHVWVRDTGVGIDPADLPHIFERFYRADRSRTRATGGSGLGLAIVKAIITAHGGTLWAESVPNEGTRISFTLPLAR